MPIRFRARLRTLRRGQAPKPTDEADNLNENRRYWDRYAQHWTADFRGYELPTSNQRPPTYRHLGDEWGHPDHVSAVLEEFVFPFVTKDTVAMEIGPGGGRVAAQIAPRIKHLYCVDISSAMLDRLRVVLNDRPNVSFVHVEDAILPPSLLVGDIDFIYAFDVFVHLDLHVMWKYIRQIALALRPGGKTFLHTSNLLTKQGWKRFSDQDHFNVEGHYFVTPEIVACLAGHAGLHVEKTAAEDATNFYKARDHLIMLRK